MPIQLHTCCQIACKMILDACPWIGLVQLMHLISFDLFFRFKAWGWPARWSLKGGHPADVGQGWCILSREDWVVSMHGKQGGGWLAIVHPNALHRSYAEVRLWTWGCGQSRPKKHGTGVRQTKKSLLGFIGFTPASRGTSCFHLSPKCECRVASVNSRIDSRGLWLRLNSEWLRWKRWRRRHWSECTFSLSAKWRSTGNLE